MSDGSKRYLGDVWINKENLDRQREFFQDILESYQYKYGGDFDASTLQGKEPSDFATAEQGLLASKAIQAPLLLGKKEIANVSDPQYIYTDAIRLADETNTELPEYQYHNHPWFKDLLNKSLTEALLRIYTKVTEKNTELQNNIDNKLDTDTYNTFITDQFTPVKNTIDASTISFVDERTQETTRGFNASLINGLRPILITRAKYNELKNGTAKEQEIVNHWRNIFIFVDELPPDYNAPYEYSLTDPYTFRINENYLQVTNNIDGVWKNVASLASFLEGANFDDVIEEYIERTGDFVIGTTSLANSLQALSASDIDSNWDNYPFLSSSLHDDFVNTITINQAQNYLSTTVTNSLKKINIDVNQILKDNEVLTSAGAKRINNINNELQTQKTNLQNTQTTLSSVQQKINQIQQTDNSQNDTLSTIQSQLSNLQNSINSINNTITNINNTVNNKVDRGWQEYMQTAYGYTDRWGESSSYLFYNLSAHMAWARINYSYEYKVKNKGKWIAESSAWFDIKPGYCQPISNLIMAVSQNFFVKITNSGKVHYLGYYGSDKDVDFDIVTPVYATKWW